MSRRTLPLSFAVLLAVAGGPLAIARAQPQAVTTVRGETYRYLVNDGRYVALPRVRIHVIRDGNLVGTPEGEESWQSGADGTYKLVFRSGTPVQVVYHLSKDFVPDVQYLA